MITYDKKVLMLLRDGKKIKIFRFLGSFFILGFICIVTSFSLNIFAFRFIYRRFCNEYFLLTILLLLFLFIYFLIYKKVKRFRFFWKALIYSVFVSFVAPFLWICFNSIMPYSNFLRYRSSLGRSIESLEHALDWVALAIFIGFIILIFFIELKRINNLIKPLFYWLFSVLIGWYFSIPVIILYTGFNYQRECIWSVWPKGNMVGIIPDYCYTMGESIYYSWEIFSGILVFFAQIIFIFLYFHKFERDGVNGKKIKNR